MTHQPCLHSMTKDDCLSCLEGHISRQNAHIERLRQMLRDAGAETALKLHDTHYFGGNVGALTSHHHWPRPLRVWWIPQVPMKAFYVEVETPAEAILVCDTLARYDTFQYENNVKPDYSNAGGIQELDDDGEWSDVWHEDEEFWGNWG